MKISYNIPGLCAGSYAREKYILSVPCIYQNFITFVLQYSWEASYCRNSQVGILRHNCSRYLSAAFCFLSLTNLLVAIGRFSASDFPLCNSLLIILLQNRFCMAPFLQKRYQLCRNHFNSTLIINLKCFFICYSLKK